MLVCILTYLEHCWLFEEVLLLMSTFLFYLLEYFSMLKIYLKYSGLTLLTLCALGFMLLLVHPVQRYWIRSDIRELNIGLSQEMRWNIQLG